MVKAVPIQFEVAKLNNFDKKTGKFDIRWKNSAVDIADLGLMPWSGRHWHSGDVPIRDLPKKPKDLKSE